MNVNGLVAFEEDVRTFKKHIKERIKDGGNYVLMDGAKIVAIVSINNLLNSSYNAPTTAYNGSTIDE